MVIIGKIYPPLRSLSPRGERVAG